MPLQQIEKDFLWLYRLMSGDVESTVKEHCTPAPSGVVFNWARAFGLCLWFGSHTGDSIGKSVAKFDKLWKGIVDATNSVVSVIPKANHVTGTSIIVICGLYLTNYKPDATIAVKNERYVDIFFHVLRLASSDTHLLRYALAPSTIGAHLLDYRLPWLLHAYFQSIHERQLTTAAEVAQLHVSFAEQLVLMKLVHWAVFVSLHLEDSDHREHFVRIPSPPSSNNIKLQVRSLLLRYEIEPHQQEFLTSTLCVPITWIAEGQAYRELSMGKYETAVQLLLDAELYQQAHDVFLEHLAPNFVADERYDDLLNLLERFQPDLVPDWMHGGLIYFEYAGVCSGMRPLIDEYHRNNLDEHIITELVSLRDKMLVALQGLTDLLPRKTTAIAHVVCREEMATNLITMLDSVSRELSFSDTYSHLLTNLPLAEEQRLHAQTLSVFSLGQLIGGV